MEVWYTSGEVLKEFWRINKTDEVILPVRLLVMDGFQRNESEPFPVRPAAVAPHGRILLFHLCMQDAGRHRLRGFHP